LDGIRVVAQAGIEIANRVRDRKILVIVLADLLVFSNGILQLALLDELLRGAKNLLLVEPKTERHRIEPTPEIAKVRSLIAELRSQIAEVTGSSPLQSNLCNLQSHLLLRSWSL